MASAWANAGFGFFVLENGQWTANCVFCQVSPHWASPVPILELCQSSHHAWDFSWCSLAFDAREQPVSNIFCQVSLHRACSVTWYYCRISSKCWFPAPKFLAGYPELVPLLLFNKCGWDSWRPCPLFHSFQGLMHCWKQLQNIIVRSCP